MSPRRPVDVPRRTAYDVVLAVEAEGAYANLLLPRLLRERGVDARDAAFTTELAYGTLRWAGVLDQVIATGAKRSVDALDPQVRAVLRLGAYQILHMRVAAHAAVHSTVDLARAVAGEKVVSFVNAVLRRVAELDWPGWVDRLAPAEPLGRLAFEHGQPLWIVTAFADALHDDVAELRAALAEDRPVTHLVARPGRVSRDDLLRQAPPGASAGPWSPYAVRLAGGDPASIAAVREGAAAVQDEGSQLVALALTRAEPVTSTDNAPGERWLDACAGPGGKAALLAGLLPVGGRLVAVDAQPHRARLVRDALAGASGADAVVADGRRPPFPANAFDRALVDAPCTGLGALRRRPEVRWRRTSADIARLVELQRALLTATVDVVRPGGIVAYVTCSPHPAETRQVVEHVLGVRSDLEWMDARECMPGLSDIGPGPDVQLWPHRHGTDAMYLALLRRSSRRENPRP
ncbi:MAG TPA: transcription antitermination factor NusB [Mycobacteriales bacterium]|nr:transcription antitermination factor NusB [Mycobacteriales bacterium]